MSGLEGDTNQNKGGEMIPKFQNLSRGDKVIVVKWSTYHGHQKSIHVVNHVTKNYFEAGGNRFRRIDGTDTTPSSRFSCDSCRAEPYSDEEAEVIRKEDARKRTIYRVRSFLKKSFTDDEIIQLDTKLHDAGLVILDSGHLATLDTGGDKNANEN